MARPPQRPRIDRDLAEFAELLEDQLSHLQDSCTKFDKGELNEYRRIAMSVRMIAYDQGQSISLLTHNSLKRRAFANSACPLREGNLVSECDLIEMVIRPNAAKPAEYRACLDGSAIEFVEFDVWWNSPVMSDQVHDPFSRKDIIKYVANQDGGAHVDGGIDAAFEKMRKDGFRWTNGRQVTGQADRHAVRQIGHELLKSLRPSYRRQHNDNSGYAVIRSPVFREVGFPPGRVISGYHDLGYDEPCPCLSGEIFGRCHRNGAVKPRKIDLQKTTARAPSNAATARMGIGIGR